MLVDAASSNGDVELDQDPPADVLDPSTRRQIRVVLEHLGCRDLYDALGVSRDAPKIYIEARADEERQRWMKKAQVTAEKTAWLEIITHGAVAPELAQGTLRGTIGHWPRRPRSRSRAWRHLRSRG